MASQIMINGVAAQLLRLSAENDDAMLSDAALLIAQMKPEEEIRSVLESVWPMPNPRVDCGGIMEILAVVIPLFPELLKLFENCPQPDDEFRAAVRRAMTALRAAADGGGDDGGENGAVVTPVE